MTGEYEVSVAVYQHVTVEADSKEEAKEKAHDRVLGRGSPWTHSQTTAINLDD